MFDDRLVIVNHRIKPRPVRPGGKLFLTASASEGAAVLLKSGAQVIEFAGGDGTFSATLDAALLQNPDYLQGRMIRIQPRGTGNDRHKSLHEIFSAYRNDRTSQPSVYEYNGRHFLTDDYLLVTLNGKYRRHVFNIAGIGLDSQALIEYEDFRGWPWPSSLKYFGAATRAIHKLNGYHGKVEFSSGSGGTGKAEPIMFLFMLGKYFGGGMPVNGRLQPDDGRFESVILQRGTPLKLYRTLAEISLLGRPQYKNDIVRYLDPSSTAEVSVISSDKFYFESDGEIFTVNGQPLEVQHLSVRTAGKITYMLD